jgi:nucleoside 2-deoxyribosyltransferase
VLVGNLFFVVVGLLFPVVTDRPESRNPVNYVSDFMPNNLKSLSSWKIGRNQNGGAAIVSVEDRDAVGLFPGHKPGMVFWHYPEGELVGADPEFVRECSARFGGHSTSPVEVFLKQRIYLVGSLRNEKVPILARALRERGFEVFDDWYAAGPEADDYWQKYEKARGHDFQTALQGHAAKHVHEYDKSHLDRCHIGVMLMPAGKSGHLELGYMIGQGKPCFIVLEGEPERFDVMYRFATVCNSPQDLFRKLGH